MKKFFYYILMMYWVDRALKYVSPNFDSKKFSTAMARSLDFGEKYRNCIDKSCKLCYNGLAEVI